ncbi:MAG: MarR family transcriptional regulator [Solirubrobacteraceae bacterium MAG38_C4-C5]|nr:MarR family transcriptional regulator [Candidatus Siliceabacter maunaloa]
MDSLGPVSAAEVARRLGSSIPRVKRAIERLGLDVEHGPGGRVLLTDEQVGRLLEALGSRAVDDGLTATQTSVLAALSSAPLGLASARAVARRGGLSPTAAARALGELCRRGLVEARPARIAAGRARTVELLAPSWDARWPALAPTLARVQAPRAVAAPRAERVPGRLGHLFWNSAPEQLDVQRCGGSIARRLLRSGDLEGLAWGAAHLRTQDWQHGATARGLDAPTRRLAHNLAAAA